MKAKLRGKMARIVFRVWFSSSLYTFETVGGEIQHKCFLVADKILNIDIIKQAIEDAERKDNERD